MTKSSESFSESDQSAYHETLTVSSDLNHPSNYYINYIFTDLLADLSAQMTSTQNDGQNSGGTESWIPILDQASNIVSTSI